MCLPLIMWCCAQGRTVVRLKGGCPSVFSRVASELAALRQAGVETEMVPGISSALAAPVLAGGAREGAAAWQACGACMCTVPANAEMGQQ